MAVIGTITTWLKAKTTGFNRNMDKSRKRVSHFQKQAQALKGLLVTGLGFFALNRAIRSSITAFFRQEEAIAGMEAGLRSIGQLTPQASQNMQAFASRIQEVTTVGDEAVLELMKMGSTMGKLSGQVLKDATKAAIGLSEAYGIELVGAMRLVARASVGDTASLKRYGITLDATLSTQEKFNALLKIGAHNFQLAEAAADTMSGRMKQLKNTMGDVSEVVGKGFAEIAASFIPDKEKPMKGNEAFIRDMFQRFPKQAEKYVEQAMAGLDRLEARYGKRSYFDRLRALIVGRGRLAGEGGNNSLGGAAIGAGSAMQGILVVGNAWAQWAKKAETVFEQTRTSAEKYAQTIKDLNAMLKAGAINQQTHTRAVNAAFAGQGPLVGGRINMSGIQSAIMQAGMIGAQMAQNQSGVFNRSRSPGAVGGGDRFTGAAQSFRSRMDRIQQEQLALDKNRNATLTSIDGKIGNVAVMEIG